MNGEQTPTTSTKPQVQSPAEPSQTKPLPTTPTSDALLQDSPPVLSAAGEESPIPGVTTQNGFFHNDSNDSSVSGAAADVLATAEAPDLSVEPDKPAKSDQSLQWTSSAVAGQKSVAWYLAFILVLGAFGGVVYLISKDVISAAAIALVGVLFGAFSIRKPHAVQYALDSSGIIVGQKHFVFAQFRSFSVLEEGGYSNIALLPLQRFSPILSISYDPQLHDQIVNMLSEHLPFEQYKRDALDQITARFKL